MEMFQFKAHVLTKRQLHLKGENSFIWFTMYQEVLPYYYVKFYVEIF